MGSRSRGSYKACLFYVLRGLAMAMEGPGREEGNRVRVSSGRGPSVRRSGARRRLTYTYPTIRVRRGPFSCGMCTSSVLRVTRHSMPSSFVSPFAAAGSLPHARAPPHGRGTRACADGAACSPGTSRQQCHQNEIREHWSGSISTEQAPLRLYFHRVSREQRGAGGWDDYCTTRTI